MFKVLLLNNIAQSGLDHFDPKHYQVGTDVTDPDIILVRSTDLHSYDIPASVKVIGRAGAGVNNIPIDTLTERGIPVMNTPGANANAVKELVITGMLLAARNICSAWHYAQNIEGDDTSIHQQVESNKKNFAGFELPGKRLGIIGLGNIGVKVANGAEQLGMEVIGYDPAMTVRNAWELSSSIQQAEKIEDAIVGADFISLHVPLNDHTKNLIDNNLIKKMNDGAVILNFARDGIVDLAAVEAALVSGKLRYYVCDFPNKRFLQHPRVIALPHLGASTKEAEENCARMIVEQTKRYLEDGHIKHSVNFPEIKLRRSDGTRYAIVNANVPKMLGQITGILSDADINIIDMLNRSKGDVAYTLLDIENDLAGDLINKIESIDGVLSVRKVN